MRRTCLLLFCLLLHAAARSQELKDTVKVFFRFNEDGLTEEDQLRLDSLVYNGVLRPNQSLKLIGYGDYVGSNDYNLDLSRRRAVRVQDYLIGSGFDREKIVLVLGKGRIDRPSMEDHSGYAPDRRVDIVRNAPEPPPPVTFNAAVAPAPPVTPLPPASAPQDTMTAATPLPAELDLTKLSVNQTFVLDNIYFYTGRHFIKKESLPALDQLVTLLSDNPTVKVRIEGHVCCIAHDLPDALDEDSGGLNLSVNRARYIYDYLIHKGIEADRLSYRGFGHRFPVVPIERTDEEAQKNRRVEVRIIGK